MTAVPSEMRISKTATVLDALRAVQHGACGLCIITDEPAGEPVRFVGMLSDGDLRRMIINGHGLDSSIEAHVNESAFVVDSHADRGTVLETLQSRGLSAAPIVDDGHLVGVHTLRDLIGGQKRSNVAVVMAGGKGSRLGDLTKNIPKPMLLVAGRPILERIVLKLVGTGVQHIALSTNFGGDQIEAHFGNGCDFGCRISYLREDPDTPLGTAGSLSMLEETVGPLDAPVLVTNGDILISANYGLMFDTHADAQADLTIAASQHTHKVPFGVIEHEGSRATGVVEKPDVTWLVGAGINVIEPHLIRQVPRAYFDMTDLYDVAFASGHHVNVAPLDGGWIDVGRPTDLAIARGEQT